MKSLFLRQRHLELDLRELFGRLADPAEEGQPARILGDGLRKDFDGDFPVELRIHRPVDLSHAPAPRGDRIS